MYIQRPQVITTYKGPLHILTNNGHKLLQLTKVISTNLHTTATSYYNLQRSSPHIYIQRSQVITTYKGPLHICTYNGHKLLQLTKVLSSYLHTTATSYYNLQRSSPHIYIQRPQVITTYKGPLHICTYNGHKLLQLTKVLSTYLHTTATSYYNLQRSSPHMYIQRPQVITTYKGPLHIFTNNGHKLLQLTKVLSSYLHTTATSYYNLQRSSPHMYIQRPQVITTYKGPLHIFTNNGHKLLQLTKVLSTYLHTTATSYYNLQWSSPHIYIHRPQVITTYKGPLHIFTYNGHKLLQLTKVLSTYVHTTATSYYNLQRSSPHIYIQRPQVITTYKGPLHIFTYNGHKLLQLTKVLSTYVHTTATSYYNLQRSSPHMYIQRPQVITTYKGPLHICTYNGHKLLQLTKVLSTYLQTIIYSIHQQVILYL